MSRHNSDLKLSMLYDNASLILYPIGDIVRSESVYFTVSIVSDIEKNRDREVR